MTENKQAQTPTHTPEIKYVDTHRVSCNGGGGALGHPLVWYSLEDGKAQCGYCDVQFVYRIADTK
ncbi:MAG: zinc-finger domain-containing protein [Alphaproteobacteria bacterium]|nr:zinc-finger domain-containing protein [Marinicaulis sp.]NOX96299.1 zinc-finger domain-containing protein [Alphaproteobacteria bacterium]